MATSPSAFHHARSTSVPSSPNPFASQFDDHLSRLRSSLSASTSSSVNQNILALQDLYNCFDELLLLPLSQQALAKDRSARWVDNMLDRSLRLLDVCNSSRDAVSQTKECLQEIQSVLRRRCGSDLNISKEVSEYIICRKEVKKVINKSFNDLKSILNESAFDLEKSHGCVAITGALNQVEEVSCSIFESLLESLGGAKNSSRKSSWALMSKFKSRPTGEFQEADVAVQSLICPKRKIQDEDLRMKMMKLESDIQDLDQSLECLFRCLVKSRATILNILNL